MLYIVQYVDVAAPSTGVDWTSSSKFDDLCTNVRMSNKYFLSSEYTCITLRHALCFSLHEMCQIYNLRYIKHHLRSQQESSGSLK